MVNTGETLFSEDFIQDLEDKVLQYDPSYVEGLSPFIIKDLIAAVYHAVLTLPAGQDLQAFVKARCDTLFPWGLEPGKMF